MTAPELRAHGRAGTALALLYVFLWSSAFVPSRVLSRLGQPLWVLTIRFAIASVLMAAVVTALRRPWPRTPEAWLQIAIYGLLANASYLGCTYEALRHLSSGMGAIIASTNPLLLALVAPALLDEPLTPRKVIGLLLGFAGVLIAMWARAGSQAARPGDVALAFLGVVALVGSTLVFKRLRTPVDLLAANTIQLGTASVALLPLSLLLEGTPHLHATAEFTLSLAYLILVMSLGASFLWFWLLRHGEASRVSAFYFLTPIFGLALGALLLGETVRPLDGLGLAAVAAGIVLVQSSHAAAASRSVPSRSG
ncbi:MAG TPA: DMT family transporter [Myxococcaceae bacterium]|nr:DMT family transporter [Myxococcaceae bacterium]